MLEDQFFEQVDGAAMGSLLSLSVLKLYMKSFEGKALSSAILTPTVWCIYVDNSFVLWPVQTNSRSSTPTETNSTADMAHNVRGGRQQDQQS